MNIVTPSPPPEAWYKNLHQLARDGEIEVLKSVLASDNEISKHINDLDEKKLSPLHYAARYSNIEVMQILINNGADPNRYRNF